MLFSSAASTKPRTTGNAPLRLLLTNEVARKIFGTIFNHRRIRFRNLLDVEPTIDREELKRQLKSLVEGKLVASTEMPVEDLQTYYVTRTGLSAERLLRQIGAG